MTRPSTRWHMLGMSGPIIAVKFVMARHAIRAFGGIVVCNPNGASVAA